MASKKHRSPVWEHFDIDKTNKNQTVCKICSMNIKFSTGSTSAMNNHLKRKHAIVVSPIDHNNNKASSSSSVKVKLKDPTQTSISDAFQLKNKLSRSSERHLSITNSIAIFMAKDMRPYSVVENEGFKQMLRELEPRFEIPSRRHFADKVIPNLYTDTRKKVENDLQKAQFISLTTDSWTSRATQSYNTVTVHYIYDFEMKSHVLQTRCMEESHTSEHLAAMLTNCVEEWQLKRNNNMPSLTTDNARNILNAGSLAGFYPHVGCVAHTINLATQKGLKVQQMDRLLGRIRRVVTFFHKSTTAMAILSNKQTILEIPQHKLISDVPTRWNSTFDMIQRFIEQNSAIEATLQMKDIKKNAKEVYTLSEDDIANAEHVLKILGPIKKVTTLLCGEKSPTISLIHPLKEMLLQEMTIMENDSPLINAVKTAICNDLKSRYTDADMLSFLLQSSCLDPRFKTMPYITDSNRVEVFSSLTATAIAVNSSNQVRIKTEPEEILGEETAGDNPSNPPLPVAAPGLQIDCSSDDSDEPPLQKKPKLEVEPKHALDDLFGEVFITHCETAKSLETIIDQEILDFKGEKSVPLNTDPLLWWKQNEVKFPKLAMLARKFFCIPATSVASERVFSTAGDLVSAQRSCLSKDQVDKLIFLKKNLEYK